MSLCSCSIAKNTFAAIEVGYGKGYIITCKVITMKSDKLT